MTDAIFRIGSQEKKAEILYKYSLFSIHMMVKLSKTIGKLYEYILLMFFTRTSFSEIPATKSAEMKFLVSLLIRRL
jgi:hypothetical protein